VEDVAAGREAVDVLVGERAEVLVADGADRPCGGGGHGGAGIRGCAALVFWRWKRVVFPSFISRDGASSRVSKCTGDFVAGRFFLTVINYFCFFPTSLSVLLQTVFPFSSRYN
jgi:hypothetical protein